MTIQFRCKGCRYECTEPESDHARNGFCATCNARGVGLPQIKKVEKWEARDGSFHDSLEAAQTHQLMAEVTTALRTCDGRPDSQARHLLSHFDIVRKGDMPKGMFIAPATIEYRKSPKDVCRICLLVWGIAIGLGLGFALMHLR
jgi:hypothetical protein